MQSKYIPKSYQKEYEELKQKLLDKEGEIEYLEDKIIQLESMRGISNNDIKVSYGGLDYENLQRTTEIATQFDRATVPSNGYELRIRDSAVFGHSYTQPIPVATWFDESVSIPIPSRRR